jgi:hypothetical protein
MVNPNIINLLPPREKEALLLERVKNLIMVLGNMVLIAFVCLILILYWVKFYLLIQIVTQQSLLYGIENPGMQSDATILKNLIPHYNKIFPVVVKSYQNKIYFSDILNTISTIQRPQGLYFKNISLDGQKFENKVEVKILGFSSTRDNILLFKKKLEEQAGIESIYFTPESWINPTNTDFNLTIEFKRF